MHTQIYPFSEGIHIRIQIYLFSEGAAATFDVDNVAANLVFVRDLLVSKWRVAAYQPALHLF